LKFHDLELQPPPNPSAAVVKLHKICHVPQGQKAVTRNPEGPLFY